MAGLAGPSLESWAPLGTCRPSLSPPWGAAHRVHGTVHTGLPEGPLHGRVLVELLQGHLQAPVLGRRELIPAQAHHARPQGQREQQLPHGFPLVTLTLRRVCVDRSRKGEGGDFLVASGRGEAETQVSVQDKSARQEARGRDAGDAEQAQKAQGLREESKQTSAPSGSSPTPQTGWDQARLGEACRETRSHSLLLFTKPGAPEPPPGPEAAFP